MYKYARLKEHFFKLWTSKAYNSPQEYLIVMDSWVKEISENKENSILMHKLQEEDKKEFSKLE